MNHFELFNLAPQFDIDTVQLKQTFLQLQQQYHPDKADDKEQALIKSSEINQAYQTLLHIDSRAAYLLQLHKQDYHLDQSIHDFEFLDSALEIREQLDDAQSSEELKSLRTEVLQWIQGLMNEFKIDFAEQEWNDARDTVRKLRFFQKVLTDIDVAEDRLLDDDLDNSFDDDF